MAHVLSWARARRKAIAALLTPLVSWAVLKLTTAVGDLTLPANWPQVAITVLTGVVVHELPNTPNQEG